MLSDSYANNWGVIIPTYLPMSAPPVYTTNMYKFNGQFLCQDCTKSLRQS